MKGENKNRKTVKTLDKKAALSVLSLVSVNKLNNVGNGTCLNITSVVSFVRVSTISVLTDNCQP